MLDTHSRDTHLESAHDLHSSGRRRTLATEDFTLLSSASANFPKSHFRPKSNLCANSICLDHVSRRTHTSEELKVFVCRSRVFTRTPASNERGGKSFALLNNVKGLPALWHFQDIFDSDTVQRLDLCSNETIKCLLWDKPHDRVYTLHKLILIKR